MCRSGVCPPGFGTAHRPFPADEEEQDRRGRRSLRKSAEFDRRDTPPGVSGDFAVQNHIAVGNKYDVF